MQIVYDELAETAEYAEVRWTRSQPALLMITSIRGAELRSELITESTCTVPLKRLDRVRRASLPRLLVSPSSLSTAAAHIPDPRSQQLTMDFSFIKRHLTSNFEAPDVDLSGRTCLVTGTTVGT